MKLHRAKFGFFDDEWCGEKLVKHYVAKGTVLAFDNSEPEPNLNYWQFVLDTEKDKTIEREIAESQTAFVKDFVDYVRIK